MALMASLLTGCVATTENVVPPVVLEDTSLPGLTIVYGSEDMARSVGVVKPQIIQEGGLMRLTGSIKNLTQYSFPIEYQIIWSDGVGGALPYAPSWQRVTLPGRAQKPFSNFGKDKRAAMATINFRFPKDIEIFVPEPDPMELMKYQQELQARQAQGK